MAHKNKIVAILSSDRSGSTWLGYVLGSTPEAAFLGEFFRAWDPSLRVPCSWCAANGVAVCPVLDGLEAVPVKDAFAFAFSRVHRPVLIDSSKRISWIRGFLGGDSRYDIHLVHLIRDPRGWYASERRRQHLDLNTHLDRWTQEQKDIRSFLAESEVPFTTVFYEELAGSPVSEFRHLCGVLDIQFSSECLRYWRTSQHGFAANGASSLLMSGCTDSPRIVLTGDDNYYHARREQFFVDKRWQLALTDQEIRIIEDHPQINELFSWYGRKLLPQAIGPLAS